MVEPIISARNLDLADETSAIIKEKIAKHKILLEKATAIVVMVEGDTSHKGNANDYKITVTVTMPQAFIKVKHEGSRLNTIIDELDESLRRRLKRYHDQYKKLNREVPWKARNLETNTPPIVDYPESYAEYEPVIKHESYEDERPMHPAEAVEKMELLGHTCYLFRNIENSKYAMIYKRQEGGYGLVEPKNGK